jgi:hypothetical protein
MLSQARDPAAALRTPLIWALQAEKAGDNAQVDTLLEALGLPVTVKRLCMGRRWQRGKPRIRASLGHLDRSASDALEPPWPDLIVLSGRRLMNVALWVREQSLGHTRLVLVGRPHGHYAAFDLIVAAPQFRLPARANVINLDLPLIEPPRVAISEAAQLWRDEFAALVRPVTAVLVGGPTQPFRFDAQVAQALIDRTLAATAGAGTLYVSTSRRTPAAVTRALASALPPDARLFRWAAGSADNPYLALLALADRFVVTGDSASMLVEVARLGRPLAVFELPVGRGPRQRLARLRALFGHLRWRGHGARPQRDITELHRALYRMGLAVPLGEPFPASSGADGAHTQLAAIRTRICSLLGLCAGEPPAAALRTDSPASESHA